MDWVGQDGETQVSHQSRRVHIWQVRGIGVRDFTASPVLTDRHLTISTSYNQSKKTVKYSRAALALWWSAASNACVYPGTGWDSAYCTVLDGKGRPSGVILVMSREEHNKDFKANVISGPTAD